MSISLVLRAHVKGLSVVIDIEMWQAGVHVRLCIAKLQM